MTTRIFTGQAVAIAQVVTVEPATPMAGNVYSLTINNKSILVTAVDGDTVATIVSALVTAWNASTIPEFTEVTAAVGTGDYDGMVVLTGDVAGKPFIVVSSVTGIDEVKTITLGNSPTGGTWDYSDPDYGDVTGIAYNASTGTLETALEGIYGSGNIAVTGSAGAWILTFGSTLAATNISAVTVDGSDLTGGSGGVTISTVDGTAGTDAVFLLNLDVAVSGGTFTLSNGILTTAGIAYNADDSGVEAALDAVFGTGNFSASGAGALPSNTITITAAGDYRGTALVPLVADGASLTGGSAAVGVAETTAGVPGANQVTWFDLNLIAAADYIAANYAGGLFTFTFTLRVTTPVQANKSTASQTVSTTGVLTTSTFPSAAALQSALEAVENVGAGNVAVSQVTVPSFGANGLVGYRYIITYQGALATTPVTTEFVYDTTLPFLNGIQHITDQSIGSAGGVIEQQTLTASGTLSHGTFTVTLTDPVTTDTYLTAGIPYDSTAAEIAAYINAAAGAVICSCTGGPIDSTPVVINFNAGNFAYRDVDIAVIDDGQLTASVTVDTPGVAGTNEVVTLTMASSVFGGTVVLTHDSNDTAAIAYNASPSTIAAALEALSSIADVSVTGAWPGTMRVEFIGSDRKTNMPAITATPSLNSGTVTAATTTQGRPPSASTVTTITDATGPNHWDDANNWTGNAVPVTSDVAYIKSGSVDILYGLDQSAVTLTKLVIDQGWNGRLGLPTRNSKGYYEYRSTFLSIGATTVIIGDGEGRGSSRINLNQGSVQTAWEIHNSGRRELSDVPAILLKGTHASNTLDLIKGDVGLAFYPNETATVATLRQGYLTNQAGDTTLYVGIGVTLTTVTKTGGSAEFHSGFTTLTHSGGEMTVTETAAVTTVNLRGGDLIWNSTGTITTVSITGEGHLDLSQDLQPKTITNPVNLFGNQSRLTNPYNLVSGLVLDLEQRDSLAGLLLGTNVSLTVGSVS